MQFICANTDAQALNRSAAEVQLQLGSTGLGAGSKPEAGRSAAEEAVDQIRDTLEGANMVFITAGMGGGTGTGAAPVIARVAKRNGHPDRGRGDQAFRIRRQPPAEASRCRPGRTRSQCRLPDRGLNEKLLEVLGDDITQEEAFGQANDVLKNAVGGISDIIHIPGLVNVDFEDVKTVMSEPGKAMMAPPPLAALTVPPRQLKLLWLARCWKASTCRARVACWC